MNRHFISCLILLLGWISLLSAQNEGAVLIEGQVQTGKQLAPVSHATVLVKGQTTGAFTNDEGQFQLRVSSLPVILLISCQGYESRELEVQNNSPLSIRLDRAYGLLNVVVVAPNRIPTKLLNSPVSVENLSLSQIRMSPSVNYYDATAYLKGIDHTTSGMLLKTISTRGFNYSGNTRFNQLMDGMDNQAPGLNFPVGGVLGLPELDVESMELLPGASSALYGPGGMNGTLLVNSRNPFHSQGLSIQVKTGLMHVDGRQRPGPSAYQDYSLRFAKVLGKKFAFKINAQYISANDWRANDTSNYQRSLSSGKVIPGTRASDPNYDGVNVYGDETSVDVRQFVGAIGSMYPAGDPTGQAILAKYASMTDPTPVSRTGYYESEVADPQTFNFKLSGGVFYQINSNLEASFSAHWGNATTVYTGSDRYDLKDVRMGQYKLELKHKNWFLRGYTTQENAGQSYSMTGTMRIFNEAWKPSYDPNNPTGSWYLQYAGAFVTAALQGADDATAHQIARSVADQGRPVAGSREFKTLFDQIRSVPISQGGGLFLDKSDMWMAEGQYNFSDKIHFADIVVGGNWKQYVLNSRGTIFIDTASLIHINEWGAYAQISKKLLNDHLTISASGRYDKNANFKGRFTPRATALVKLAENHNLRFSYQTAYRFPSTQQQYIKLEVTEPVLLGGLPWVQDWLHSDKILTYEATENGIVPWTYKEFKPESVQSYEVGYKSVIQKRLLIDVYAYWARYQDFLGRIGLVQPTVDPNKIYSIVVNSPTKVKTHGMGAGITYEMPGNYSLFANWYNDNISNLPPNFQALFNTPKNRVNAGLSNSGLGKSKRIGFNIMAHWQESFFYENDFAQGTIPSFITVDAQVNYKFSKAKTMLKLGASNLFNHYYKNGFGNPEIGGLYYVSVGFNVF